MSNCASSGLYSFSFRYQNLSAISSYAFMKIEKATPDLFRFDIGKMSAGSLAR